MQRGLRGQRLPSHLHRLKATQLKLVRKRVSEMSWSRDTAWGKGSARHSRAPSSNYVLPLHSDVQEIVGEETVDDFSFVWAAVML